MADLAMLEWLSLFWLPDSDSVTLKPPSIPVSVPSYRLLNFELSFEKKEVRAAEFRAEVSCEEMGTPYWLVGAGLRVWPEWKVDLAGTCLWKAAGPPLLAPGDTACFRLELSPSPPRALVLSVEELILRLLGSMADRLLWAGMPTALRPVALDIVLDLVIPRAGIWPVAADNDIVLDLVIPSNALGEVGVLSLAELKLPVLAVLGLAGVAADWLSRAVFSLIVALSTVFWRLKFELVVLWLLLVVRGTAVGGPVLPLLGLLLLVALILLWTPRWPPTPPPDVWAGLGAVGAVLVPPPTGAVARREREDPLLEPSLSNWKRNSVFLRPRSR